MAEPNLHTHRMDKDKKHTYCGLWRGDLSVDEIFEVLPPCPACDEVLKDSIYVRNHLQSWWEAQMKTKGMPS